MKHYRFIWKFLLFCLFMEVGLLPVFAKEVNTGGEEIECMMEGKAMTRADIQAILDKPKSERFSCLKVMVKRPAVCVAVDPILGSPMSDYTIYDPKTANIDKVLINENFIIDTTYLNGVFWSNDNAEQALFYIRDGQLTYVEDQKKLHSIKLENNILSVDAEVSFQFNIILLTENDFWYIDNITNDTTKLYRSK